jgi:hypothetical protein
MTMDTNWKQKWIDALQSGNYVQRHNKLRQGSEYCCLGVLCDVVDPTKWKGNSYEIEDATSYPTQTVLDLVGLEYVEASKLAELNDNGASFAEIARHIKTWL